MRWLIDKFAPFKSELFAMVGVLAVCGLGAAVIAYCHIQQQRQTIEVQSNRIDDLVTVNKSWANWADSQQRLRDLEQQNTRLLQDKLALIESDLSQASVQLDQLEASNAEVKELLGRRLPADLRRLLEGK
jgi:uncharacterized protein HemX